MTTEIDTDTETRISDANAEQLLHDLVAIPSPSHEEEKAVEHLTNWMRDNGYDSAFVDDAGNAIGIIGSGSRDIVLLGHIDTFGGFPPVKIEDRLLYGRGSVDAKGSLCTFAVAGRRANLSDDMRLIVIGAVEEEARSSKGAHFAKAQYQPEMCVIGEPSNWDRITLGYKGRLLLEWEWRGDLAHSAGQAATGGELAFAYWQRVQDYAEQINDGEERIFGKLDVTLQEINTGQDGAYGWAKMTIGFRLPPTQDPHKIAEDLSDSDVATITAHGHEVAVVAEKNTKLSAAFRGAIRANGGTPRFVYKTGTADMNVVNPVWQCPIVAYGPGDSALDHTPDEHINLDEYLSAIRVLTDTLNRL